MRYFVFTYMQPDDEIQTTVDQDIKSIGEGSLGLDDLELLANAGDIEKDIVIYDSLDCHHAFYKMVNGLPACGYHRCNNYYL